MYPELRMRFSEALGLIDEVAFPSTLSGHDCRELFARTEFRESIRKQPFSKEEWRIAVERALSIKEDFYTILSDREAWPELARMIAHDTALAGCFE